ncbi:MAG TPA: type II secretion system F family protein [Candidatus Limnocylindria bacterium]|nr:type II secretion system F family protein [Candidatus Limnocylindria bacterium]
MLTYKYTARDTATGKKVTAEVQAASEQAAAKLLRDQGLSPVEIRPVTGGGLNPLSKFKNRIKIKDKILFSRQLSTLINAGLPLVQSLRTVAGQTQNKSFKIVTLEVITDVEAGTALSVALSKHPGVFNEIYISLIAAGEVSGTLDKSLERLANQQEKDAEIISKVRGAMVYPIIVLVVMGAVVTFMMVKVMPQVEQLYEGLGDSAQLPQITTILLIVSRAMVRFWYVFVIVLIVMGILVSRWARTLGGKRYIDKIKMRMPPLASLFMKMYMARFARTGTTLVASGVPLIQMLQITGKSINNVHIEESLRRATEKVKGGKALSETLVNDPNFLQLVPDMLRIGEQSGAIEQMLEKTADYYEKEVDNEIKAISTIIEPALMVVLGVVAFVIVAAVLLPIYGLAGQGISV